jgi:hypothetical protein
MPSFDFTLNPEHGYAVICLSMKNDTGFVNVFTLTDLKINEDGSLRELDKKVVTGISIFKKKF